MFRIARGHSTLIRSRLATALRRPVGYKVLIGGSFVVGGLIGGAAYRITEPSITLKSLSASDFQPSCNSTPCVLPELKSDPQKNKAKSFFRKLIFPSALCVYLPLLFIGELCLFSYSPLLFLALLSTEIFVTDHEILGFPLRRLANYLEEPKNVIKKTIFEQIPFIDLVNRYYPDLKLEEGGSCYGLMILWYLHHCCKKDCIAELIDIRTQIHDGVALSQKQLKLLKDIAKVQKDQHTVIYIEDRIKRRKMKFTRNFSEFNSFGEGSQHFASIQATEDAMSNLGELINFSPRNEKSSHAIGLIASCVDNKYEFKVFDPDDYEATFGTLEATQADLSQYSRVPKTNIYTCSLQEKFGLFSWKRASCLNPISITPNDELQTENLRGMLTA